jgi:hypothetical protein
MSNSVVPQKIQDFVAFAQSHADTWASHPAAVGLTPAQCSAFNETVSTLYDRYVAQKAAESASRNATGLLHAQLTAARAECGNLIKAIRGFAANAASPAGVYAAADLPMPAEPAPLPPPALPTNVGVTLDAVSGAVTLRWKAANPAGSSGTTYVVRRKLPADAAPVFLGTSGAKRFTDSTLPAGTPGCTYFIRGERSGVAGPEAGVMVNFGVAGGAPILLSVAAAPAAGESGMKMAA